jgi:hypothetical protein
VGLISFKAEGTGGAVLVTWQTGTEVDNLGFHLYRREGTEGEFIRLTEGLLRVRGMRSGTFTLTTVTGRSVARGRIADGMGSKPITLPAGMYLVRVRSGSERFSRRVVLP